MLTDIVTVARAVARIQASEDNRRFDR